jgi:single-strand DNA-binding protein
VTGFTLAVNRSYKDSSGQNREQTSFIDCSAWGKPGEIIAQYVKKGSALLVSGRLDQRSWEDKETKQKRSKIEVVVEDFTFLPSGGDRGATSSYSGEAYDGGGASNTSAAPADVVPEDVGDEPIDLSEIPF